MTAAANPDEVHRARLSGAISARQYWAAVQAARDHRRWARWGRGALLALALAHILAAAATLIAANWQEIPALAKLTAIAGTMAVAVGGAAWCGLDRPLGRALMLVAAALAGLWLAAFSQIYQTGADSYDLFLTWAVLIAAWTLAARAPAMLILFAAVMVAGLWLYAGQVLIPWGRLSPPKTAALIGIALLGATAVMEGLRERGTGWLTPTWPRACMALGAGGHIAGAAIAVLTERSLFDMLGLPRAVAAAVLLVWLYRGGRRGLAGYTVAVATAAVIAAAIAIRVAAEIEAGWIMAATIAAIAVVAAGAVAQLLLRAVRRAS